MNKRARHLILLLGLLPGLTGPLPASAQPIQPYVLAQTTTGELQAAVQSIKDKLSGAGFQIVGEYAPYAGAHVVAVTEPALLQAAAATPYGGFGAVEHVAATQVDGVIQVSYLNLDYLAAAYRMDADLSASKQRLAEALGAEKTFGAEQGRSPEQLRNYRYMVGMERFDDFYRLGTHPSYEAAVDTVTRNLEKQVGGAALVYRVQIPGKQQTVFGVSRARVSDTRANDKTIMADTVDQKFDIKTTAYLPYQMMVAEREVIAMHMRFRMAVWHPDLTMATFGKLITSPGAIEELLRKIAGGKRDAFEF
ncbi:hypothetical protein [Sinimarinibacterium thermocellulolyticum]|uniref:Uncharacterized protein n=1 Tax=Sinimarinibacterium thermocellulolyticum TaxID=3170016 RepID=A0ABV2ADD8_9GAMM